MNSIDDERYWGLTPYEAACFHLRLADYYQRQAAKSLERGDRSLRNAQRLWWFAVVFILVASVVLVLS